MSSPAPHLNSRQVQRAIIRKALKSLLKARFTPPPTQSLSEWADANRVLSAEASAEPGRWRTSRTEYLRGVMDAFTDPTVRKVVVTKAAQVGYTEVLNNVVGYFIDRDPSSIMVIQPSIQMGETWSKKRLAPMLRDTPCLRGKVKDPKSRDSDNTILEKGFPGGYLTIVGANAPSGLASRPIRVVLADEVDRYPPSAGTEGDPLTLGAKRQASFWNRKTLVGSTPVDKGTSVVEREYLASDMRRFYVPCPYCEHAQVLHWRGVVWDRDENGDHRPETARYLCEECGALWTDAERWRAIGRGEWRSTRPFNGTAGFHIPGFLSPWLTLREIVQDFLDSRPYPSKFKTFVNTVWGEPWEERGERSDPATLRERVEAYSATSLPEDVKIVTAGVDHQDDRLEVTFVGWGEGEEAWVISHHVLPGEVGEPTVWNYDLDALLQRRFRTELGRELVARAVCIDSGGHHGNMVHAFCRRRRGRRIYATKGMANTPRGAVPIWSNTTLRTKNAGDRLYGVGVDTAKDDLSARLRLVPRDGERVANAVHFPMEGLSADYFEQLTSEQAVTELNKDGRPVRRWKLKPGQTRNEALDCFILAYAALLSLQHVRLTTVPLARTAPGGVAAPVAEDDDAALVAPTPAPPARRQKSAAHWSAALNR